MNTDPSLNQPETVFFLRRRQLLHTAAALIFLLLMVLAGIIFFRPAERCPILPAGTDPPARSASPSERAAVILPELSAGEFDIVLDMEGFSEDLPVFVFTFSLLEGKGLCLTRNAKQCEQLLDFSSGTLSDVTLFLPKDAELLGVLQYQVMDDPEDPGGPEGWYFTPVDQWVPPVATQVH